MAEGAAVGVLGSGELQLPCMSTRAWLRGCFVNRLRPVGWGAYCRRRVLLCSFPLRSNTVTGVGPHRRENDRFLSAMAMV